MRAVAEARGKIAEIALGDEKSELAGNRAGGKMEPAGDAAAACGAMVGYGTSRIAKLIIGCKRPCTHPTVEGKMWAKYIRRGF